MSFSCVMLIVFVWLWWCAAEDFLICDVCDCHSGVEDSVFWDDKQCRFVNSHLICLLFDTALTSQKTRIVDMLSYVCRIIHARVCVPELPYFSCGLVSTTIYICVVL
jgi:hypothetical protein